MKINKLNDIIIGGGETPSVGIIPNSDTTPELADIPVWKTAVSGSVTITNFTGCNEGTTRKIVFSNSNTTLQNGVNIKLQGGIDFTGNVDDTITLIYVGLAWHETGRSLNS